MQHIVITCQPRQDILPGAFNSEVFTCSLVGGELGRYTVTPALQQEN